jgi:hypothetical protein
MMKKQSAPNIEYNVDLIRSPLKFEGISSYKSNYVAPPIVQNKPMTM